MGEGTIKTDLSFRRRTFTKVNSLFMTAAGAALALALTTSIATAPASAGSSDKTALTQLEQHLFMKTYESEDDDARVGRLEKQVFGSAMQGDVHERLERITAAVAPRENPDGSVSGLKPQQQQAVAPPVQQQHQMSPQSNEQSPADEQAAAMNRAQVAVQAAREENINKLLGQGVSLWRSKRSHEAIEKFEEVLRLDPGNAEANFSMGIAYESAGNYAEALASYQRAAQQKPQSKEYVEAVAAVQRKVATRQKLDDKQGELRVLAEEASAAYKRGEYLSALDLYKQLDEKAPNQALVKYNIGTLYLAIKNPITALEYYKQAHKLKPNEARYTAACEQLETNVHAAQEQREKADRAWDEHESASGGMQGRAPSAPSSSANHKQKKPPKTAAAAPLATPQAEDAMASIGIIAKSTHEGVTILQVGIASRASRVGLLRGDVIKAVDGTVVTHTDQINKILSSKQPGSPVQMTIQRAQKMGQVTL